MLSKTHLHKKNSPSGEITLYIGQRDFIDHYRKIDHIDGMIIVPLESAHGRRLFVEIQVHFRYGAEADEFANVPFKKTAVLSVCELFPFGNQHNGSPIPLNNWQTAVSKKFGKLEGICPFRLEFPQGTPPSLVVAGSGGLASNGEPCGLTYHVVAYLCTDPSLPLLKRNMVDFKIRIMQESLGIDVLEQLSLAPSTRPAVSVSRQFFLSPGRILIEMCLDRAVVHYGDKVAMHVVITNSTNRTIRKIKCKIYQLSQLSFASGVRRTPIFCLETGEGCPIQPGASLQRSYTLIAKLQPHRSKENLVFEAPATCHVDDEPIRLSATTLFPYTDPKQGFAILVSYEAKIKVYLGNVHGFGDVSASVPFFLFYPPQANKVEAEEVNDVIAAPTVPSSVPKTRPRMIRLTSVDNTLENNEPLLIW